MNILMVLFLAIYSIAQAADEKECDYHLVPPQIEFTQKIYEADVIRESTFCRLEIKVTNPEAYPSALFRKAPDLPPCGLNSDSSRTWVDIVSADKSGDRLYGFCGLDSLSSDIWFAVKKSQTPPDKVVVVVNDRKCGQSVRSNELATKDVKCNWKIPKCSKGYEYVSAIPFDTKCRKTTELRLNKKNCSIICASLGEKVEKCHQIEVPSGHSRDQFSCLVKGKYKSVRAENPFLCPKICKKEIGAASTTCGGGVKLDTFECHYFKTPKK